MFDVSFEVSDYRDVIEDTSDPFVIYLDPPYYETNNNLRGVYTINKFCYDE
jgi:site-specific DNA-adenine methylase